MKSRSESRPRVARKQGPDSIAKNTTASFIAQLTTASLTAVLTLFLVRALGPRQYGLFALTLGISTVTIAFADLGLSGSTARFVAEHRTRPGEVRALIADALKLKLVVTGFLCAVLAAGASVIANAYGNPSLTWPLRGMAIATFGQSVLLMLMAVAVALGRTVINVWLVAAESILEFTASVGLVLAGAEAAGAAFGRAFAYAVGALIGAVVVLRLSGRGPLGFWRRPRRSTVRKVGVYAGSIFAIDASFTVSSSLSVLLVGAYVGSAASGIFQAPARLITLIQYVGYSAANGVAPRLARGSGQEPDVRALNAALRGLIGFQCFILAPAVVWARPITHVLLGAGYSRSADVLRALAPYIFFSGLAPLVTLGVSYVGEARRRVPISLATLALAAVCGVILIPSHGVVGAAIATDIAFGFYTLGHIWLCRRLFELRIGALAWSLACGLTAAAVMGIALASVGTAHLTATEWLLGGAGGSAGYVLMLIFTRELEAGQIVRAGAQAQVVLGRVRAAAPHRTTGRMMHQVAGAPTAAGKEVVRHLYGVTTAVGRAARRAARGAISMFAHSIRKLRPAVVAGGKTMRRGGRNAAGTAIPETLPHTGVPGHGTPASNGGAPVTAEDLAPSAEDPAPSVTKHGRRDAESSPRRRAPIRGVAKAVRAGRGRPAAAKPPAWIGTAGSDSAPDVPLADSPAARVHRQARSARAGDSDRHRRDLLAYDDRRLPPAAQPPAWLSDDHAPPQPAPPVVHEDYRLPPNPDGPADQTGATEPPTGDVYEIVWRADADAGAFELRRLERSDGDAAKVESSPVAERSRRVRWGWPMAPPPTVEARRAHAGLIRRLRAAGWEHAGLSDSWFAVRFRSPATRDHDSASR